MRLGLLVIIAVLVSGCATSHNSAHKDSQPKNDPYEDSVLNTIKKNQEIYKEQQIRKPNY